MAVLVHWQCGSGMVLIGNSIDWIMTTLARQIGGLAFRPGRAEARAERLHLVGLTNAGVIIMGGGPRRRWWCSWWCRSAVIKGRTAWATSPC